MGPWQQKPQLSESAGRILSGSNLWPTLVNRRGRRRTCSHRRLRAEEFLRGLNGDYQRLRNKPELWEQYLAERQEWDALA